MVKSIVVVNHKGGSGKTTTVYNLAAFLAKMGNRVLAVDLDPQANLTISFRFSEDQLPRTVADVFEKRASMEDVALHGVRPGLHLVPACFALGEAAANSPHPRKQEVLKYAMTPDFLGGYDYVLLDTPRADSLLTFNGLVAAQYVLVPFYPDYFGLTGIKQIFDIIAGIRTSLLNPGLKILGMVVSRYNDNATCRKSLTILGESQYAKYLCQTVMRESARIPAAVVSGRPLAWSSPRFSAYQDYNALTREILERTSADA